jgi:mono/diheme cytochrome c family protein
MNPNIGIRYFGYFGGLVFCLWFGFSESHGQQIDFARQIRPILNRHCIACHGPDESHRAASLRLDNFDDATSWAIVPGELEESEVYQRIHDTDPHYQMPPPNHSKLTEEEILLLEQWIVSGAKFTQHWAFIPPEVPEIPESSFPEWSLNPIDHFIGQRLQGANLAPNPPADPLRLLRRLALDLTGLPPTADQIRRMELDSGLATYEAIVDELLQSQSYGEHWAAMWLDLARYADTIGYTEDHPRTMWPWRDWLIQALNQNVSFDRLTLALIAGDLLAPSHLQQPLATAFHRNTLTNSEGGTIDEEFRVIAVKDRVNTTMNVWMGLTFGCAECHTHKYDPISIQEYYRFYDFFNQTADSDRPDDEPRLDVTFELAEGGEPQVAKVPVMQELSADKRRETFVMNGGNYLATGEKVTAATPFAFHPLPDNAPSNRLGVAQWLVSWENPLTARVTVNRYWSRLFGTGIVETEEDFGLQGGLPSHPELLDWLACDFQQRGWDVKRLLKQIVMSATYRQCSGITEEKRERDPLNRYVSRGPRNRLPAEVVRDQALSVSGLLSDRQFGPPVFPPSPIKEIRNAFAGVFHWQVSAGEDRYRRAIYTFLKRSQPHPLFETFDTPSRQVCGLKRIPTNTPLQSLMTFNDEAFFECAQHLARQMMNQDQSVEVQIQWGLERALGRQIDPDQLPPLVGLYLQCLEQFSRNPSEAGQLLGDLVAELDSTTEDVTDKINRWASLTIVANVILNLDEFLSK